MTSHEIARLIDHAVLHPTLTRDEVRQGVIFAREVGCATVCVRPCDAAHAAELLRGSQTGACVVIGFPLGVNTSSVKAFEAQQAIRAGAAELDMVVNIAAVVSGDWASVKMDIEAVQEICSRQSIPLKVIFEIDFLSEAQIIQCCRICRDIGVAFVKTSTGFGYVRQEQGWGTGGATVEAVRLMKEHAAPCEVKASGGVRTLADLMAMVEAGATRIGCGATEAILAEAAGGEAKPGEGY